jgi:putative heme-binding domain-containing protein
MARHADGGMRLIALAAQGKLPGGITDHIAEQFDQNPQPAVRALAGRFFRSNQKQGEQLPAVAQLARMPGDAGRGEQLAMGRALCAKCHRFGKAGTAIGPDLSDIGRKFDRPQLLESILNPSSAIALGYETWVLAISDGRVLSGFIIGDGETILIKDVEGRQHAVPANEIEFRQQQTVSLMPPSGMLSLAPQDLADIAEFLSRQRSGVE